MDPNKTWQEIALLLNLPERQEHEVTELRNHISNLFGWIKQGGFLPEELCSLDKMGCLFVLKSIWENLGD